MLDGCEYREALQAVRIEGGVAGNVVPDARPLMINHRFAPDRTVEEADGPRPRRCCAGVLEDDDDVEVVDIANGAAPALDHPLLAALDRAQRLAGAGQARLDRRRPLRRPRHPRRQLRSR